MKKIIYLIPSLILIVILSECAGYKPIFGSSNLNFIISDYSIEGEKSLGNQFYNKIKKLSLAGKDNQDAKSLFFYINSTKDKTATVKDSKGKITEYKITLKTIIKVNDDLTNKILLDNTFTSSVSYKIQSSYSDTIDSENKSTDNLINKTYQDLLIQLSKSIVQQ
mgnify:CR=1 FL=1